MLETVFFICVLGVFLVLAGYPAAIALLARLRPRPWKEQPGYLPRVSIITVAREAGELLRSSLDNFDSLDYPREKLELVLFEDGPQSEFLAVLPKRPDIIIGCSTTQRGKAYGLNQAAGLASGAILVFKDADAQFPPDVLTPLLAPLSDPDVGCVCGQRVIGETNPALAQGQSFYISLDSSLKQAESQVGSITSNDGKIYAIRRELRRPVPDAVTDDLYTGLQVVAQGKRLVFQPKAIARIPVPSRDAAHEMERRRRIVSTSLRGIWLCRTLWNPFRYGAYALGLFINKVLRRLLPVFALGMMCTSAMLSVYNILFLLLFIVISALVLGAFLVPSRLSGKLPRFWARGCGKAYYALLGGAGTFLGWYDFLRNRRAVSWTPRKTD